MMSPIVKLFTLQPSGVVRYIFDVDATIVYKIIHDSLHHQHRHALEQRLKPYSSYFGTISQDGFIEIWGFGRFCRPVLKLPTKYVNCSWATVRSINHQIHFFVYSRGHSLYVEVVGDCNPEGIVITTNVPVPVTVSAGFMVPHVSPDHTVTLIDKEDNFVEINISSRSVRVIKLPGITHLTFFTTFDLSPGLVLVGSENGKVSLIKITSETTAITLDDVNLLNTDIISGVKSHCNVPIEDNVATPLCCTGHESTAQFVIGTRANILVHLTLHQGSIQVTSCKRLPFAGIYSVTMHPDRDKVLVHGWDSKVRLFQFPNLEFLKTLELTVHSEVSAISFFKDNSVGDSQPYLIVGSGIPALMTIRPFDLNDITQ